VNCKFVAAVIEQIADDERYEVSHAKHRRRIMSNKPQNTEL
jgi:hypothetical protein